MTLLIYYDFRKKPKLISYKNNTLYMLFF